MPTYNAAEIAILGFTAILIMYHLSEESTEGMDPPPPTPPATTRPAPPTDPSFGDWAQILAEQMMRDGDLSSPNSVGGPSRTGLFMASAARGFEGSTRGEGGGQDLGQIDVVQARSEGGHGFVSGRGL